MQVQNLFENKGRFICRLTFDIYTLFDGLAYNTCGYFASCVVFFRAPQGRGKIQAMSKMSARIIC